MTNLAEYLSTRTRWENDCLVWLKYKNRGGYGVMAHPEKPKAVILAHRFVYSCTFGEILGNLKVMHSCDNRACVNIEHLSLGTQADNIRDMMNKKRNRHPKGEEKLNSKLTWDKVRVIREYGHLFPTYMLCALYGVSRRIIWLVKNNLSWKA